MLQSISIINEGGKAVEVVKQQDDGLCTHLSEHGLCTIQQRCGHEYLPETCRQYPREALSNKATQLHTAHLSCPGVVQLLSKIVTKIDLILTKYILVKFKNHGFPWYLYKNSLELTFLDCVIPYSQINLILFLLYESENKLSENDIIMTIYKVEKTVAHNTLILQQLDNKPELLQIASYAGCWINS